MLLHRLTRPSGSTFAALLLLCLSAFAAPVAAQEAPDVAAVAPQASAEDIAALIQTLENETAREELTAQLRALLAAREAAEPEMEPLGARVLGYVSERIRALSGQIALIGDAFDAAPDAARWIGERLDEADERARAVEWSAKLFVALFGAFLLSWLVGLALARPRRALSEAETRNRLARVPPLLGRLLLDLVPIGIFAVAGFALLALFAPPDALRVAALTVLNAHIVIRLVAAASRFALAPNSPKLRLPRVEDESAAYLYIWIRRLVVVGAYGYMLAEALRPLGAPLGAAQLMLKAAGLLLAAMATILILQNRQIVAGWLRKAPQDGAARRALLNVRRRLADVWHVLAIGYVALIWLIWAFSVQGGFAFMARATVTTVVVLAVAAYLSRLARQGIQRGFALSPEVKRQYPQLEARANLYLPILERVTLGVIWIVAALALLDAWGLDSFAWLDTPAGLRVLSSTITIAIVLALAVAIWEFASNAIERYLTAKAENGDAIERSARARTLLPLARNALLVTLIVVAGLMILAEIGVNIAPLLAGAGVIGLAVGFGSQTLVKDVITGLFILFEDTISVGDVVRAGDHSGLVEAISIRAIRLRDFSGSVHTIPFSEVTTIVNLTKEFSFYVFDVSVAYREDVDEVTEILKEVGADMMADPYYGALMLEPIEVFGVDSFGDNAVVIKARIKTKPIKQWEVGRAFNGRMKKAFDARGVEIPFPQRTVWFGEPKSGKPPAARIALETSPESGPEAGPVALAASEG